MNNLKDNRNLLTRRLQMIKQVTKEMQDTKLYAVLMISVMLAGIFSLSPVIASLFNNVTIRSSGTIATILPLHIEGRYIKNFLNQTVTLRGVNKVEFADDPDGTWMGSTSWSDENVKAELDAMKSWDVNVVRCHFSVELWKYDVGPNSGHSASPYCRISAREAIKRLINFAMERGIYVILDAYSVRCYYTGGKQDPLPFPPYQTSVNASEIIANISQFVDFWRSVANELKDHPNVIFEPWNEPSGNDTAKTDWFNAVQQVIDAIRETGAINLIIIEWGSGSWVNLSFPPPAPPQSPSPGTARVMDWVLTNPVNDTLGNIVYSTHIYRSGGAFHWSVPTYTFAWEYNDIKLALYYMWINYTTEVLNKPVLIGEVGADLAYTGEEYEHELMAWNNTLTIFNEWGLHYTAFWWRNTGVFRLLQAGQPWVPPSTESGQIFIDAIKSGK